MKGVRVNGPSDMNRGDATDSASQALDDEQEGALGLCSSTFGFR